MAKKTVRRSVVLLIRHSKYRVILSKLYTPTEAILPTGKY